MQATNATIICVVTGPTPESVRAVEELAKRESAPDTISTFLYRTFPGGVEERVEQRFRIGDYFENVEVADVADDPLTCRIVFHVRSGADSFWKDLIDRILSDVRTAGGSVKSISSRPVVPGQSTR